MLGCVPTACTTTRTGPLPRSPPPSPRLEPRLRLELKPKLRPRLKLELKPRKPCGLIGLPLLHAPLPLPRPLPLPLLEQGQQHQQHQHQQHQQHQQGQGQGQHVAGRLPIGRGLSSSPRPRGWFVGPLPALALCASTRTAAPSRPVGAGTAFASACRPSMPLLSLYRQRRGGASASFASGILLLMLFMFAACSSTGA